MFCGVESLEDLTRLTPDAVDLLVDAGWIKIEAEYWGDGETLEWRVAQRRKWRRNEWRGWDFKCSLWKPCKRLPETGVRADRRTVVARVDTDLIEHHLIKFRLGDRLRVGVGGGR